MSALNRKLLRDLWAMAGQVLAIALVLAAGMAMWVMYLSNFQSLQRSQQSYYENQRFADVFASLKRAPGSLADRIADIPGVVRAETRVVADVVLDVPGLQEPASGRLISVPADRRPALNDLYLREGRWISPGRPDEVLASEAFTQAHGFHVGDRFAAIINGRKRTLDIVGIVLSPEYVYSIRPGELVPDDRLFGVFWMERRALANAFDMEGGFNDVVLKLAPQAQPDDVIARLDTLLERYGGLGAIPRALQPSHWTLESELQQLRSMGIAVPAIFLLVTAFVLNVALSRALALQRPQLAALKALGYRNDELAWHYLKWALAIATLGALLGVAAGAWLGAGMTDLYAQYFSFPQTDYRVSPGVVLGAIAVSLLTAMAGAYSSVRRSVRIPPAEAMRPEPPARYRRSIIEQPGLRQRLGMAMRMILRNLERQPLRALASITGIAFAAGILLFGFSLIASTERLISLQFSVAERQDVTVNFVEPASSSAHHALARLPGVLAVEPQRTVPARLRAGFRHRDLAITGLSPDARLRRIVDMDGKAVALPPDGLVLSTMLARVLDVVPGDRVALEVLQGHRPQLEATVAALVDDSLGLSAYMDIDAVRRMMREGGTLSGAAMKIDLAQEQALSQVLKSLPSIAGVAIKRTVIENFRETMSQNIGLMITINVLFAGIIAFGVIYNAARVSLSERSRELASLRVLGFTLAEISLILLGELVILTAVALPFGAVLGHGMAQAMVKSIESEVYRFPLATTPATIAWSALVVIAAATVSGLIVRRRLDRLDLVGVLKTRE
ncbi:ABC transporter permease [Lysobacter alkalisoli]|uniref:ABC transporter permease n=1 Tax=Marilutibacter alkalisoli TaxID=2591633 RepID=A0A514BWT3_9GAMM|nr:ABC transporter permease [Lysobacter alkalisoli]